MKIKTLKENAVITLCNEDLEVGCDVPNGVKIIVKNGNVSIQGAVVGQNVEIAATTESLIHFKYRGSCFKADYALRTASGISFGGPLMRGTGTFEYDSRKGDYVYMDGKRFKIPTVTSVPKPTGYVTIEGNITDTTKVCARIAKVSGRHLKTLEVGEMPHEDILYHLLSSKHKEDYENIQLFHEVVHTNDKVVGIDFALMLAASKGKLKFLKILINKILTDNKIVHLKTPFGASALPKALEGGHMACVEALVDAGAIMTSGRTLENNDVKLTRLITRLMENAHHGKCEKQFMELIIRKKILRTTKTTDENKSLNVPENNASGRKKDVNSTIPVRAPQKQSGAKLQKGGLYWLRRRKKKATAAKAATPQTRIKINST